MSIDKAVKSALARRRPEQETAQNTHCSRCGSAMECGVIAGAAHCWCMDVPVVPVNRQAADEATCLCSVCLASAGEQPGE